MFEEKDEIFEEENQKKLIEQIKTSSDCRVFGVSRFKQKTIKISMVIEGIVAIMLISYGIVFYQSGISDLFLLLVGFATFIVYLILYYLNFPHNHFKTYVSSLGIAKKSEWDKGAIPWDKIEYIEVKDKRKDIDYIIFRSGPMKLGYRNSHFVTRLSLEIISEYVGVTERWHMFDDLKETSETFDFDILYMHPDIDKSEGLKKLEDVHLMEWIGEQDYDADKTREHPSSKSDAELYQLIMDDPQCECLLDAGKFSRTINKNSVTILMAIVAILTTFYAMSGGLFASLSTIIAIVLFCLIFYGFLKSDEKLIMSPIGVARYYFGRPISIEWQHVEYIDVISDETSPLVTEFFGNKRRVFCPDRHYKHLITIDIIRKYISDIDNWEKMKRDQWPEDTFRLVRPDA